MLSGSRFYHCALLNLIFFHLGRFCFPAEIIFSGLTASVCFCGQQNVTGAHFYVVKNITISLRLPGEDVKCWLRMSRFSAILYSLDNPFRVPNNSVDEACNNVICMVNY